MIARVLGRVPMHGLEPVLVAVDLAVPSPVRDSAEHIENVLLRLPPPLQLTVNHAGDRRGRSPGLDRYDRLPTGDRRSWMVNST